MKENRGCDLRGQNETIGMVLLIGLVLTGSVTIVVLGATVRSDDQQGTEFEAAQLHLQELDSRFATLAAADAASQIEFEAGDMIVSDYRIKRDGYVNFTVDRRGECSFNQSLSSLVYEDGQGRTVGYEAVGVWRSDGDGSIAVSSPSVTFVWGELVTNHEVRTASSSSTVVELATERFETIPSPILVERHASAAPSPLWKGPQRLAATSAGARLSG